MVSAELKKFIEDHRKYCFVSVNGVDRSCRIMVSRYFELDEKLSNREKITLTVCIKE